MVRALSTLELSGHRSTLKLPEARRDALGRPPVWSPPPTGKRSALLAERDTAGPMKGRVVFRLRPEEIAGLNRVAD